MVDLRLTCEVKSTMLEVEYKLVNRGKTPLIAFDGATGKGSPVPDLSGQVDLAAPAEELRIFRIVPKPPAGLAANFVKIPNVSQTLPGETRTVLFQLPFPIREQSEVTPDTPRSTYAENTAALVTLVIGYFWKAPDTKLTPFPSNPEVFRLGSPAPAEQRMQASAPARVKVLRRTDPYFARTE